MRVLYGPVCARVYLCEKCNLYTHADIPTWKRGRKIVLGDGIRYRFSSCWRKTDYLKGFLNVPLKHDWRTFDICCRALAELIGGQRPSGTVRDSKPIRYVSSPVYVQRPTNRTKHNDRVRLYHVYRRAQTLVVAGHVADPMQSSKIYTPLNDDHCCKYDNHFYHHGFLYYL